VIGAKLSEGLNFADDLARAVIIIGLPFANLGSPELRERMKYVKRLEEKRGLKKCAGQKDAAAELYENMCMNAVNQTIGEYQCAFWSIAASVRIMQDEPFDIEETGHL
jgi:chromosome transmission fidelity protein 1